MRVSSPFTVISRLPLPPVLVAGLLLGGVVGSGCTPGSSGPPSSPDTTTTPATRTTAPSEESSTSIPNRSSAPSDSARTVAQRLADASVAARVKQALVRTKSLRRFTFSPTVVRGHLTLRGDVDTRKQYRKAARIAENVDGVRDLTNQVTVQGRPVSSEDASSGPSDGADPAYHTVRRGDTLSEIARAYNVSVQRLRALNDLSGSLQPGERIRVR